MAHERKNAQITGVSFGKEDHGIMTLMLRLTYDGSGQGFGGYALDNYDPIKKRRIGTAYGMEYIMRLLDTLEIQDFGELEGQHVRVEADWNKVYRIGHILKDKWFDPETDMTSFREPKA